jgi:acyl-ACP thioesterase
MYTLETRIRYSECGEDNRLSIPAIINYFQDCTTENSERAGVGFHYLQEKKRAWLLNSWHVVIEKRPEVSEEVAISTWATGFNGILGPRDFVMKSKEGEVLVKAHSLWVYVDTEHGRPMRPDQEEMDAYDVGEPLDFPTASHKIQMPSNGKNMDKVPVRRYHIDTNHHVNNGKYVEIAYAYLPNDFSVSELRVEYKKAVVLGDTFHVWVETSEEKVTVGLCDEMQKPYAIIEFIGERTR